MNFSIVAMDLDFQVMRDGVSMLLVLNIHESLLYLLIFQWIRDAHISYTQRKKKTQN